MNQHSNMGRMRFLAVMGRKGGVGKTTLVAGLGWAWGEPWTVWDLDPQGSLSVALSPAPRPATGFQAIPSIYEGVKIVPAPLDLANLERTWEADQLGLDEALGILEKAEGPVLFDCPPSDGVLTLAALCVADGVVIPTIADGLSSAAVPPALDLVERVRSRRNRKLELLGVVARTVRGGHGDRTLEELQEGLGSRLCKTTIPTTVSIAGPMGERTTFDPMSLGGRAFRDLAVELRRRMR